jgi:hypothetical protein
VNGEFYIQLWSVKKLFCKEYNKSMRNTVKELKITPIWNNLLEYKRHGIQHVNRMPCNRLPRIIKHYFPFGRRNHERPLKRLLYP